MTLDDPERQNKGFYGFLTILDCKTHLKSKLHRNQLKVLWKLSTFAQLAHE